jgi:hypothetical protein
MNKKTKFVLLIAILACFAIILSIYVLPIANKVRTDLDTYATHTAYRDNYKLHTTPLSTSVTDDMCLKLGIRESSQSCKPDAVVYAPEFLLARQSDGIR